MSHGCKHHFWSRIETRVLLNEIHYNFCNGDSNEIKWITRDYGQHDHLFHSQVHLLKLKSTESTTLLWFYDPKPIIGRLPKWLQEANFNSPQNLAQESDQRIVDSSRLLAQNYNQIFPHPLCPMAESIILGGDQKVGFCLVRHVAIFAMGAQMK